MKIAIRKRKKEYKGVNYAKEVFTKEKYKHLHDKYDIDFLSSDNYIYIKNYCNVDLNKRKKGFQFS